MPNKKINWEELKQEYFESDIEEVIDFLKTSYRLENKSYYREKTKGWRDEKQAFKSKITAKAQEKIINDVDVQKSTLNLVNSKRKILEIVEKGISDIHSEVLKKPISILKMSNDLETLLKIIKRELGEPLNIDKLQGDKENPLVTVDAIVDRILEKSSV